MDIPNLSGFADPQNVSKKGTGSFSASYINWARSLHDIRENAPGWMPEMVENIHGEEVHPAPDGSAYLVIRFRHVDGTKTTGIPHAIMDHKMKPVKGDLVGARDVADSFVRGACKAAAALFGYGWQMWSKDDPMERTAEEDNEIAEERKNVKIGKIKQSYAQAEQTEEEIKYVGNDITDQHSTPQGWLEENDPIAVQDDVQSWEDVTCPFPKHKGKTLGVIAKEDPSYLEYFVSKVDTIENDELKNALIAFSKSKNQDGHQRFDRVA
jgi:hypothetical protein